MIIHTPKETFILCFFASVMFSLIEVKTTMTGWFVLMFLFRIFFRFISFRALHRNMS